MEDYRTKVVNSHATLSQNISKFTGDISTNTGKSTSETDQIKVRGGGPWGGPTPLYEPLPDCILALALPPGLGSMVRL